MQRNNSSTCPRGTPHHRPLQRAHYCHQPTPMAAGRRSDPPAPELPARSRSPYQLTLDFVDALGDSSRQFQLRGGLVAPEYRAEHYPVTGTDQIGPSIGRALHLTWDEHPQLQADVKAFGLGIWNRNSVPILLFGGFGLAGIATAAGAGNQWSPASTAIGFATLVPELTAHLSDGPGSPGDLNFRQFAFNFRDSTSIGRNEGNDVLGLFPTGQFRGQFLNHDLTFTAGLNARYLPDDREFRLQESLGLDYNLFRFNIGDPRASFGTESRLNLYQQIDLSSPAK